MNAPVEQNIKQNQTQMKLKEMEINRELLIHLKNTLDPRKWKFIEEIKDLAEKQKNYLFSDMDGIIQNSQKSLLDLFFIKYDLSLNGLNLTDLLINFRDMSKS